MSKLVEKIIEKNAQKIIQEIYKQQQDFMQYSDFLCDLLKMDTSNKLNEEVTQAFRTFILNIQACQNKVNKIMGGKEFHDRPESRVTGNEPKME